MPDLSLQDDEYLAALKADTEKELKAREEAEIRRLEEAAAREAFLQEERHREEETRRKLLEEEVLYINVLMMDVISKMACWLGSKFLFFLLKVLVLFN